MALRHFWRNKYEPRTPAFFLLRRMDSRIENDLGMQPIWEVIIEVEVKGISWLKRWTFKAPARGQSWWRCWLPEWRPWALSRRSRRRWSTRGGCRLCWRWWRSPAFSTKRWRALFWNEDCSFDLNLKRHDVCLSVVHKDVNYFLWSSVWPDFFQSVETKEPKGFSEIDNIKGPSLEIRPKVKKS